MSELRTWATPLVAGAGLLVGVTGGLMFFHLRGGLTEPLHEWAGWLLIVAVSVHLVVNWRPLVHALRGAVPRVLFGLFAVLAVIALLPLGGRHGRAAVEHALVTAPLPAVAAVAGRSAGAASAMLARHGVTVDESEASLEHIARDNARPALELLALLFEPDDADGRTSGPRRPVR